MDIVGARGAARPPEHRLIGGEGVQLMDARAVCGRDHLLSAMEHAQRAMARGENAAKTLAVEFLLYASGERQISEAIRKMGIRADTTAFALAVWGDNDLDSLLHDLELARDDAVLAPSREKARAFGIPERELDTVPADRATDLVLERVALVDLWK